MKKLFFSLALVFGLLLIGCRSEHEVHSLPTPTLQPDEIAAATSTPPPTATLTSPPAPTATATTRSTPIRTPAPTPAAVTPSQGGQITIGLVGTLSSLNPLTDLSLPLQQITPLIYQALNQRDPVTARPAPLLTSLAEVSADGLTLTYELMPSATVSIDDIIASLETTVWPELTSIRQVTPQDSNHFTISLTQPDCPLSDGLAQFPILSAPDENGNPGGSGPFQVESWDQPAGELHLRANPQSNPAPFLEALTIRFFQDEDLAWAALEAGEIDLISLNRLPGPLPSGYTSLAYPTSSLLFVSFNHQDEILAGVEVRRALRLAVDRNQLLERALGAEGELAAGFLPPTHWAANPTLSPPDFDPDQAQTLLGQAGLSDRDGNGWRDQDDGQTWTVAIRVQDNRPEEATLVFLIAAAYRKIGVQARVELVSTATVLDDLLSHDYQAIIYGLPLRPELDYQSYWHSDSIEAEFGLNLAAYSNPQVDSWLEAAHRLPGCAAEERADLYQQIQAQLVEDEAVDFLLFPQAYLIHRDDLAGLAPGPFAPFTWNAAGWYINLN